MFLELSYTGILFRAKETDKCDPLRFEQKDPSGGRGRGEPLEDFTWDPGVVTSVDDLISLMSTETQDNSDLGLLL